MPKPSHCSNPKCPNYYHPPVRWCVRFGSYQTVAHGTVKRYRCRLCGRTVSNQTESIHYFAKRRLPLRAVWASFVGGSSMREVANRYRVSPMAIQYGILRLGRQAMAAHLVILDQLKPRSRLVFDGLRSFVTSQDYPCDVTTVVGRSGEVILTMTHTIMNRGGRMTDKQRERIEAKRAGWQPVKGATTRDISLVVRELWDYLRPTALGGSIIDTDRHRIYASVIARNPVCRHFRTVGMFEHIKTDSRLPRTYSNRLFPVNYVDRLLRHRVKEHTRETIAFGRHASMQMHRAWIFAYDHNCRRVYREKKPNRGVHAEQSAVETQTIRRLNNQFFDRRVRVAGLRVPESIRQVWLLKIPTPPVRWEHGQHGTSVRLPEYARRDLAEAYQQAC